MHTHLADVYPDDQGFLPAYLAVGTTTIRNLNAFPQHLDWKHMVLSGELVGPTIYTSGPVIAGPPDATLRWIFWALQIVAVFAVGGVARVSLAVGRKRRGDHQAVGRPTRSIPLWVGGLGVTSVALVASKAIPIQLFTSSQFPQAYIADTEERARAEVRRQAAAGYDLVKIYDYMTAGQYLGAVAEAAEVGIYSVGHIDVGIEAALEAGLREIAHVDEFIDFHVADEISPRGFQPVPFLYDRIPATVATVVEYDVPVVSNLSLDAITVDFLEAGPEYFERPEYSIFTSAMVEQAQAGRVVAWQPQVEWRRDRVLPFLYEVTRQLNDAGAILVTATDTGVDTGALPVHIHDDLAQLVEAGLTPYEALRAATVNAHTVTARMGVEDPFGRVEVEQRADLLLLARNPLDDIGATRERLGVMARGRWYEQAELDSLVQDFLARHR